MEKSKLMTPLFYGDMYNREGHKMRAVLEREISDGTQTYRLWRSAGKPDLDYPSAENDKYILHVEINGYLLPLRMTDWNLINHCGFAPAAEKLYGGKENRGKRFDALRESGGDDAVSAALAEERAEIERFGSDPVRQTKYIQSLLSEHIDTYQEAKENGGQTFPDFAGALILDDLARCQELSAVYRAKLVVHRPHHYQHLPGVLRLQRQDHHSLRHLRRKRPGAVRRRSEAQRPRRGDSGREAAERAADEGRPGRLGPKPLKEAPP